MMKLPKGTARRVPQSLEKISLPPWSAATLSGLPLDQRIGLLHKAHGLLALSLGVIRDGISGPAIGCGNVIFVTGALRRAHLWLRLLVEDILLTEGFGELRRHYRCPVRDLRSSLPLNWDRDVIKKVDGYQSRLAEFHIRNGSPPSPDAEPFRTGFSMIHDKIGKYLTWKDRYVRPAFEAIAYAEDDPTRGQSRERDRGRSGRSARGQRALQPSEDGTVLPQKQQRDYWRYEYLRRDRVHIPGSGRKKRSNLVVVNRRKAGVPDYLFPLFLRLVVELEKRNGGWVSTEDLYKEEIVPGPIEYRPYQRLRDALSRRLSRTVVDKLIENTGSGEYRLSTHPDFITYDKAKLLHHPDEDVRKIAEQLPELQRSKARRL